MLVFSFQVATYNLNYKCLKNIFLYVFVIVKDEYYQSNKHSNLRMKKYHHNA